MPNTSFLPDDYLAEKQERRTNLLCLTLFTVVMLTVFGAFLVTNRQWTQVAKARDLVNEQYTEAATKIEKLKLLEEQKEQMLNKAELAAALVERVPRSILLADMINRMPPQLSLLDFEIKSDRAKKVVKAVDEKRSGDGRMGGKVSRPKTKEEAAAESKKVEPPQYQVTITMTGVAPTDLEVSRYMAQLNGYPLLRDVTLNYSEQKEMQDQVMRKFSIKMSLDGDADVRTVDPLIKPRNPMQNQFQLQVPKLLGGQATTPTSGRGSPAAGADKGGR
jgi:Tfp pilus assembly protein PilN